MSKPRLIQQEPVSERESNEEETHIIEKSSGKSANFQEINAKIVKDNNVFKIIIVLLLVIAISIVLYFVYDWSKCIQVNFNEKPIDTITFKKIEKSQSKMIQGENISTIVGANHSIQKNKITTIDVSSSIKQVNNQNINPEIKETIQFDQPKNYQINMKYPQIQGIKPRQLGTVSVVKFLKKDSKNRTIDQLLYKNQQQRNARKDNNQKRIKWLKKYQKQESFFLAQYNNRVDSQNLQEENVKLNLQYQRVKKLHNLQEYKDQLPMCIISPSYRNNNKFRIEYNLNSIFTQNYSNYYAVIINDGSDDDSDYVFRRYFQFYNISPQKYIYINNTKKLGAMENYYIANHKYCSNDAIAVHLDGDDEFIGRNVLKIFSVQYQRRKAGVLYSNFYDCFQNGAVVKGMSSQISNRTKEQNTYRSQWRASHLKTYRTQLFRRLPKQEFQDKNGKFYKFASDLAYYYPLLEASCKRVYQIKGFHYLYNRGTGNNEDVIDRKSQIASKEQIKAKSKRKCDEQFNKKMQNSL